MSVPILSKIASASRVVAAVGCFALAARFTFVAVRSALANDASSPAVTTVAEASASSEARAVRAAPSLAVVHGELLRVTMMVNMGPDGSEVRIDDAKIGQTPFIGDIECHAKDPVHVRVVPAQGKTLDAYPTCGPGVMRVDAADGRDAGEAGFRGSGR